MKTPEELFKELVLNKIDVNNPVMDSQKYPWQVFWLGSNGKYVCHWDYKNEWFLFNYDVIWEVFEDKLNLNYDEIQVIMRSMVEEHFGLRGVTPTASSAMVRVRVEEHFGLRGVTPIGLKHYGQAWVEEHFGLRGVTPSHAGPRLQARVEEHFKNYNEIH